MTEQLKLPYSDEEAELVKRSKQRTVDKACRKHTNTLYYFVKR
jgi:hypothetical protein